MKKTILLLLLFTSIAAYSQEKKSSKMGQTTLDEIKMAIYDKDSTAAAVVLYEHANVYKDKNEEYNTRTDYYYRIKILDKKALDYADITINLYKKKEAKNIKAITYNLSEKETKQTTSLAKDKIFKVKESENWTSYKFAMPNVKVGSVIEYSYSLISPYSGIEDWYFQSDIPKIKSEYDAAILGNYKYNVRVVGFLKLDKDKPSIDKKCLYVDGIGEGACVIYSYGMDDVPAFKDEDYMLSEENYLSRLTFDLKSFTSPKGAVTNYTTTWKQADKKLKKIFFNNQTSKKSFFKKNIPEEMLLTENQLDKAKSIYTFIQNHYTWNDRLWNNEDEKVKQAFDNKTGSAGEINLSLFNALNAADINAELVILSTRQNGLPTTLFPVIFDFNYVIIKVTIDDKEYFLDATDKFSPFGQVPFRTLNGQARVINYKKESNWVQLKPKFASSKSVTAKLSLNEDGDITGSLMIRRQGYTAQRQRKKLAVISEEGYLEEFEEDNPDTEVDEYSSRFLEDLEKPLQEIFKVNILMNDGLNNKIRLNPFFFNRLKENPFKLKERNYPVNFGYSRRNNFVLSLNIPDSYKITKLPKQVAIALPNNGGSFVLKVAKKGNVINIYSRMNIKKNAYTSEEYFALKEYFKQIVIAENSYITLEKK